MKKTLPNGTVLEGDPDEIREYEEMEPEEDFHEIRELSDGIGAVVHDPSFIDEENLDLDSKRGIYAVPNSPETGEEEDEDNYLIPLVFEAFDLGGDLDYETLVDDRERNVYNIDGDPHFLMNEDYFVHVGALETESYLEWALKELPMITEYCLEDFNE